MDYGPIPISLELTGFFTSGYSWMSVWLSFTVRLDTLKIQNNNFYYVTHLVKVDKDLSSLFTQQEYLYIVTRRQRSNTLNLLIIKGPDFPVLPETGKNYGHTTKRTYILLTFMLNSPNNNKNID